MEFDSFLNDLASPDNRIRFDSESSWHEKVCRLLILSLNLQEIQIGIPGVVLSYASSREFPLPKRQLCMTLIKELIRNRWCELAIVTQQDILMKLLVLSMESNGSLRKLAHASIGLAISGAGFSSWSEIIVGITQRLSDRLCENRGYMLDLFLVIIEEAGGSALLPYLEIIFSSLLISSETECIKSFSAYTCLLVNLGRDEEYAVLDKLDLCSPSWTRCISVSIDSVVGMIKVQESLRQLVHVDLGDRINDWLVYVIEKSCTFLQNNRAVYESLVVFGEEGGIDEDEENGGISGLVVSLCDLTSLVVLAISDFASVEKICQILAPYTQITCANEHEWVSDLNSFIGSEEEDYTEAVCVRSAFEGLIADLLSVKTEMYTVLVQKCAANLIQEGLFAKTNENPEYWRLLECGLWMYMHTGQVGDCTSLCVDLIQMTPSCPPLLTARAFSVLSKGRVCQILPLCVKFMDTPIVKISASRAFAEKVGESNDEHLLRLGLSYLVKMAKDDSLAHFGIDCLIQTTRNCSKCIDLLGVEYHQFLLDVLVKRITDPLASSQIHELVQIVFLHTNNFATHNLVQLFSKHIKKWIHVDSEFELDVALDFLELITTHCQTPFPQFLVECILALEDGTIASIGENTCEKVNSIIQICETRMPGSFSFRPPRRESWMQDG